MTISEVFIRQCHREILLCYKQPRLLVHAWLFFLMTMLFFPLVLTPSVILLREVGPGIVWMAALFAMLLLSEELFQRSYEEGLIEQAFISGEPMVLMVLATIVSRLLFTLLGLLLLFPFIGLWYHLPWQPLSCLLAAFVVGVPAIFCIAAFAAALNVGRIQKTTLMALLALPLAIPVMIFGSSVVRLSFDQHPVSGIIALLGAFSLLSIGGLPFAIAAVLRLRFED